MSKIDDLLAKEPVIAHDDVAVAVRGELVTLRFNALGGPDWAELCAVNPIRPGVVIDANYGYNLHAVVKQAAPLSGFVVDGDDVSELEPETWEKLLAGLSGHDFAAVTDAVWGLNEWRPSQLVESLKKASTPGRARKQN